MPRAVDWAYPSRFEHDETGAGEMPVLQRACETVKCLLKNNPWEFLIFRLGRRRSPKWKKPGELPGFLLVRYAIPNRRLHIREGSNARTANAGAALAKTNATVG